MPVPFVEDAFFIPLYNFSFFVKNQVSIGVWINIRVLNSIPLVSLFVFIPIASCFHYCSPILELDVRDGDASGSSFIVQDYLAILVFVFPYEVECCSFRVCEDFKVWDFDGDCIESIDCFW